jgi:hypothetical protein
MLLLLLLFTTTKSLQVQYFCFTRESKFRTATTKVARHCPPANNVSTFLNYKHILSVDLLAFVDARYKFTVVDIGSYGRNSDGRIFAHWKLRKYLETHPNIPEGKKLPRILCLASSCYCGKQYHPSENLLNLLKPNDIYIYGVPQR